ncbi:hypothetical protein Tco_0069564, partial [Tanacetum coccineum]
MNEYKGIMPTKIELTLEQSQQGVSNDVLDTYPILLSFTHCGNKSILRFLRIILVILPEHPSEIKVFHNEDGNPARVNIKQALGFLKDGDGDENSHHLRCQEKTECSDTTYTRFDVMKDLKKVSKLPQTLISCISSQVHKMAIQHKMM